MQIEGNRESELVIKRYDQSSKIGFTVHEDFLIKNICPFIEMDTHLLIRPHTMSQNFNSNQTYIETFRAFYPKYFYRIQRESVRKYRAIHKLCLLRNMF